MGAFEKIPVDGTITATKLAEALNVDKELLGKLLVPILKSKYRL